MNIVLGIIRIIIIDYKFNIVYVKTSGGYISGNENGSRAFPRKCKQIYFKISGDRYIIFTENFINYYLNSPRTQSRSFCCLSP